jgi:hypothetical protein
MQSSVSLRKEVNQKITKYRVHSNTRDKAITMLSSTLEVVEADLNTILCWAKKVFNTSNRAFMLAILAQPITADGNQIKGCGLGIAYGNDKKLSC